MLAILVLALPQVYVFRVSGTYLPLAMWAVALCVPLLKVQRRDGAVLLLLLLHYLVATLAIAWSSNVGTWGNYLLFGSTFPLCFFLGRRIPVSKLETGLKLFSMIAAAHSILIVVFRLNPNIKMAFLFSGALRIFKNPDRLVGYERGDVALNIFDPLKSGGIFDNANTAATFTLVAIGTLVAVRNSLPRSAFLVMLVLLVVGVAASGSKSGVFYLVALSALLFFLLGSSSGTATRRLTVVYASITGLVAISLLWTSLSGAFLGTEVGQDTLKTGSYRVQLWLLAAEVIQANWLTGVGFGGWADVLAARASYYGVLPTWPPHNSLLQTWVETGIFGLLALMGAWFVLFKRVARSALVGVAGASGAAFALIAAAGMSMGDPTPLFGAPQFAPALGFVVAIVLNRRDEWLVGTQADV